MRTVLTEGFRHPLRSIGLFAAFCLLAAVPAVGQDLTSGAVSVRVTDTSAQPVTDVLLTLSDSAMGLTYSATADRQGRHRFSAVHPGDYTLTVERIGFAPRRLEGITVRPGQEPTLVVELWLAGEGPIELAQDRVGAGAVEPIGARQWLPQPIWRSVAGRTRDVNGLPRFSSLTADGFVLEGLPGTLSALAIDGVTFRPASHPLLTDGPVRSSRFGLSGFDAAQVIANGVDVEWSDVAGGTLSTYSRRGSRNGGGGGFGSFSGDALAISSIKGTDLSYTDIQGGVVVDGRMAGENGRFSLGVGGRSTGTPLSAAWTSSGAAEQLISAAPDLAGYVEPIVVADDVFTGFAHVDWTTSAAHAIEAGIHGAMLSSFDVVDPRSGATIGMQGGDFLSSLALRSTVNPRTRNEARVSLGASNREASDITAPFTRVVGNGLAFGSSPWLLSSRDARFRMSDVIYVQSGAHLLKFGAAVTLGGFEYEPRDNRAGDYLYGNVDLLLAGTGVLARTEGNAPTADWTERTFALFAQDRIRVRDDAELVIGLRVEHQTIDATVSRDAGWFAFANIANDDFEQPGVRVSPRLGLNWDIGNTHRHFLNAAAGIYYDRPDPLVLAAWMSDDGSSVVRRVVGPLPFPPDASPGGTTARRLTVLSGFDAPRTMRASAGFASRIADGLTVHVGGVVRRTENLPRRTDINLLPLPVSHDQHGRAVYGVLVQQGGLITTVPGSNRNFQDYDEVAAITADGASTNWGVSGGIEHAATGALNLIARYTFSSTTDDWFGAAWGGWTETMPRGIPVREWTDGTSDFDVPHRAVAAAVLSGPAGLRLGAAYRIESGRPFTPGFKPGVDPNADGNPHNDPAFIDTSIPGISELVAANSCLAEWSGTFAARNSCRGPMVQALDLSLAIRLAHVGRGAASLMVDAFDVLESAREVADAALYLVDPAGAIVDDPIDRVVTLPLMANANFGSPLMRRTPGRTVRIGLSFNW